MKSKEETALIETVMEKAFEKMYGSDTINQLTYENVSDFQRGKIAGQIQMMNWIASEFNPQVTEEVEDETGLDGQKLD